MQIGQRQHQLEPDPVTGPVVPRIFDEYIRGRGLMAIASGLMADGIPSPSAHDPARNRHRLGVGWSKSAIRAILINPRYTGHQVWNKQRKEEILLDVEDVAAGHETRMRWNAEDTWIWSPHIAHPPLISRETFELARAVMATQDRSKTRMPRAETRHPYALRGLLFCGVCKRKMQGNYNNGRAHYRCMIRADYVLGEQLPHPKAVYVREDRLLEPLDRWLAQLFDADHISATIDALADATGDATHDARVKAAREAIAAHETKILKYRDAFDSGIDAKIIARWIADAEAERIKTQRELDALNSQQELSRDDIAAMLGDLAEVVSLLRRAEPERKTAVYQHLGIRLTYQHDQRLVTAQASPAPACAYERVRGPSSQNRTGSAWRLQRWPDGDERV